MVGYIPDALDNLEALIHPEHETEVKTNIAAFKPFFKSYPLYEN